ncbi:PREDICTED: putative laccase-9 [Theobroma cacao]|uniref:Laccase n=1 Tax=Theobroma cacao TaxID=3641 RepID=A0AB32UWH2_THECC|nr:PREDICTED: putative laccase-9 [Theobroma cacao]
MGLLKQDLVLWLLGVLFLSNLLLCRADVHYYDFFVREKNFTSLCNTTKSMLVVNGSYPGPEIRVHRQDTVYVNVHNQGNYGLTIHWHGVKQPRNPWSDGPEFVTQCPIQPGTNFTYEVILSDEIGTLWWHAHSDWTRGSVHGAFVILPAENETYPFPTPDADQTIILQSWYNRDYKELIDEATSNGMAVAPADAYAINGHLGDTYACANETLFRMQVDYQKTYLLRIINAAMNEQKFFAIANHSLTVVAQDASYVQIFTNDYIMISPGQTMDVLVCANQNMGQYYMATRPFSDSAAPPRNNITRGVLQYTNSVGGLNASLVTLPAMTDLDAAANFTRRIKNSNVTQNPPMKVPMDIDRRVYVAIATNTLPCDNCPIQPTRLAASLNNVSFDFPQIDVLQAYYNRSISGVFTEDFPLQPPVFYNFTGDDLTGLNRNADLGTKAVVLNYGEAVEIVLQTTQLGAGGSHPMHLHGFSFYWVGTGSGNFNNVTDPSSYNLVDPPLINTVHVHARGWVAVRFFATNPGVWFMHCHFERHSSWGMDTVFIVKNGTAVATSILPPPASGMPRCPGT